MLALASLLHAGCGSAVPADYTLHVAVSPTPPTVGQARVLVRVLDASGRPAPGLSVSVEGTMSHAGMGTVVRPASEGTGGNYAVDAFPLDMAGDWHLTARAVGPDDRAGAGTLKIGVVPDPSARARP